jgi:hypothetical protein
MRTNSEKQFPSNGGRPARFALKAYFGFIPIAVIGIPLAGFAVRHALGHGGGCFDYWPLLVMLPAIVLGTLLDVAYLLYVAANHDTYFVDYPSSRQRVVAKCGYAFAVALLLIVAVLLLSVTMSHS